VPAGRTVTTDEAHRLAREKGVSRVLYAVVRALVVPFMRVWFRLRVEGGEHIPAAGPAIVAPNHKSFWDAFFVAAGTRRPLRYMGKRELFEGPWGRLLVRLGAFPVRRGEADADALETAREILRQGGLLAMFPEGTRVREPDSLGSPRRGAGRLALETGAPVVPAAITGTDQLFVGPLPKPKRVQVAFGAPIPGADLPPTPEAAGELVQGRVWPEVEREFRGLRARPGLIAAALAILGAGIGGAAYRRRRAGKARPRLPLRRRAAKARPRLPLRRR
jgi:1-acyl-sn-glycerol-3-phosphate acyltransferase